MSDMVKYIEQLERMQEEYEIEQEAMEKGEAAHAAEQLGKALAEALYDRQKER